MEEENRVERKRKGPPLGGARRRSGQRYSLETKLKAVHLYLEEDYSTDLICRQIGVSLSSLKKWITRYRQSGEAGLKPLERVYASRAKLPEAITEEILRVKQQNPTFGIKRISQVLRRLFFLPASPIMMATSVMIT